VKLKNARRFTISGLTLIISFFSHGQCPGFQTGSSTGGTTVSFFDSGGNLITTCDCQLTGNALKCDACLPASFTTYRFTNSGGVVMNCTNSVALPVSLKRFEATVYNGDVTLEWSTESERDNLEFIVERSSDANEYTFFAKLPGAVNSTEPQLYTSLDTDPLKEISYYRLSQRDINGTVTQLGVVSVELSSAISGTVIAPNPSLGKTKLQLPLHNEGQEFDVTITDGTGRIVQAFRALADTDLEFTPGVYLVTVRSGSQIWAEKLIVFG